MDFDQKGNVLTLWRRLAQQKRWRTLFSRCCGLFGRAAGHGAPVSIQKIDLSNTVISATGDVPMQHSYSDRVVAFIDCLGFEQKVLDSARDPSLISSLRLLNMVLRAGSYVGNDSNIDFQRLQFSELTCCFCEGKSRGILVRRAMGLRRII